MKISRTKLNLLSPQCRKIVTHMERAGHITNDAAITYYRIMALPRRISDIEAMGIKIKRKRTKHPITGQQYVRYSLDDSCSWTL